MVQEKAVTHVIFDMDGLILDTERLYTEATQLIATEYGKTYTWEIKAQCMGMKGDVAAKIIIDSLELPMTVDEYLKKIAFNYDKLFPTANLLPDSVNIYVECHNRCLSVYNKSISWEQIMLLMGKTSIESAKEICRLTGIPLSAEKYRNKVASLYPEVFPSIKFMRGAEKLVRHLHKHKTPIAIASGGAKESYDLKTTNHKKFFEHFLHIVLASTDPEVKNGKPAPDVFLICADRFPDKPKPEMCLVFEDAPNGVKAANAANMQVVMVPDERLSEELRAGATQVLSSLEDFKPEHFGLPPYDL